VTRTIAKTAARTAAAITAAAAIAACAASAPRPAATTDARRAAKSAATPELSAAAGTRICNDLNEWLAGAWHQTRPRFTAQMESDETDAGYGALGTDLMTLDWNLVNFNSGALRNSKPNHYPVTGLTALQHDCAGYGVGVTVTSG